MSETKRPDAYKSVDSHGIKGIVSWFKGKGDILMKTAKQEDVTLVYSFGKKIGSGGYASTYLVQHKKDGRKLACKSIDKKKVAADEHERLQIEVDNLLKVGQNPHVVHLYEVYEDKHFIHLVQELCAGGELFDRIIERKHYSEKSAALLVRTILDVVAFCHGHNIMHRDLKPENFLFLDERNIEEGGQLKSIDFGFSTEFATGTFQHEILGSSYYVAPEVLKGRYNETCDVWSVGVITYILLTGQPPPWHCQMTKLNRHIAAVSHGPPDNFASDPAIKSISPMGKDFMQKCIEVDFLKRESAAKLLDHPWVHPEGEGLSDEPLDLSTMHTLKSWLCSYRLKKKALVVLAEQLSDDDLHGLRAQFDAIDTQKHGVITFEELKVALSNRGEKGCAKHKVAEEEVRKAMEEMDVDGDGVIEFHEFVAASLSRSVLQRRDLIHKVFDKFDIHHHGYINKEDLKEILGEGQEVSIDRIMDEIDIDHDGKVSFEDFLVLMTRHDPELMKSYGLNPRRITGDGDGTGDAPRPFTQLKPPRESFRHGAEPDF